MELRDFRKKLDAIDEELINILAKRIEVSEKIAEFKLQNNLSIRDSKREEELIKDRTEKLKSQGINDEKFSSELFSTILSKSRQIQNEKINSISNTK